MDLARPARPCPRPANRRQGAAPRHAGGNRIHARARQAPRPSRHPERPHRIEAISRAGASPTATWMHHHLRGRSKTRGGAGSPTSSRWLSAWSSIERIVIYEEDLACQVPFVAGSGAGTSVARVGLLGSSKAAVVPVAHPGGWPWWSQARKPGRFMPLLNWPVSDRGQTGRRCRSSTQPGIATAVVAAAPSRLVGTPATRGRGEARLR